MSYATAKASLQRRRRITAIMDQVGEHGGRLLRLCGEGPRHNWSVLVADTLIAGNGCACCTVWRCLMLGAVAGGSMGLVIGKLL